MNRNEINSQSTKSAISKAFIELYCQKDISAISLNEICKKAHVSRTTFYRYYDDKYAVLEEIEDNLIDSLAKINQPVYNIKFPVDAWSVFAPVFYQSSVLIKANAKLIVSMLKNKNIQFLSKWKKNMRTYFENYLFINNYDGSNPLIITALLASTVIGTTSFWLLERPDISLEEISNIGGKALLAIFKEFYKQS